MKRAALLCCSLLLFGSAYACASADTFTGTWTAQPQSATSVHLRLDYEQSDGRGNESWMESSDVPLSQLRGVSTSDFASSGEHKAFAIVRDAGTMQADGWFGTGHGSGNWTFAPSASFANDLRSRGIAGPTEKQQFELAMGNFKIATLDTLLHDGFERPSVDDLVAMANHGVTDSYVNSVKDIPLHPKTVGGLIRMRDHGVDAAYLQALASAGYTGLSAEDAVRMRDHGVSADYVAGLHRLGYHPRPDELVRLVDHGVSIDFIERMRSHGYTQLSAEDLIRLRDHGF